MTTKTINKNNKLGLTLWADEILSPHLHKAYFVARHFMRKIIIFTLFLLNLSNLLGQSVNDRKYDLPRAVFTSYLYKKSSFERFSKQIIQLDKSIFKFGEKTLNISIEDTSLLIVFNKGIFNPDIIFGEQTSYKRKLELDSLSQNEKVFYNLTRNDFEGFPFLVQFKSRPFSLFNGFSDGSSEAKA